MIHYRYGVGEAEIFDLSFFVHRKFWFIGQIVFCVEDLANYDGTMR